MPQLRVFEVDLPAQQAWKRNRLAELGVDVPPHLVFVPVDFEAARLSLSNELVGAGFNPSAPAVISWVAVTQYLRQEAIIDTLMSFAASPAGTQLVLTYVVPPDGLTEMEKAGLAWTMRHAADRGEPFLSLFHPHEVEDLLMARGFTGVEHFGPDQLRRLYLKDRPNAPISGIDGPINSADPSALSLAVGSHSAMNRTRPSPPWVCNVVRAVKSACWTFVP